MTDADTEAVPLRDPLAEADVDDDGVLDPEGLCELDTEDDKVGGGVGVEDGDNVALEDEDSVGRGVPVDDGVKDGVPVDDGVKDGVPVLDHVLSGVPALEPVTNAVPVPVLVPLGVLADDADEGGDPDGVGDLDGVTDEDAVGAGVPVLDGVPGGVTDPDSDGDSVRGDTEGVGVVDTDAHSPPTEKSTPHTAGVVSTTSYTHDPAASTTVSTGYGPHTYVTTDLRDTTVHTGNEVVEEYVVEAQQVAPLGYTCVVYTPSCTVHAPDGRHRPASDGPLSWCCPRSVSVDTASGTWVTLA